MAKSKASDKFQGLCLESYDGYTTIPVMDKMSQNVRRRLSNSPFNICPACAIDDARRKSLDDGKGYFPDDDYFFQSIEEMENMIRCEEV